ncbi:helix-turn-helix domain-containing protein [Streptomyces uncialis]|uniref:helix-turn-helix domain-containing protein n=1 Tax=Streptomyces uncialis TaxID=1048205 RepID=UPI002258DAE7|nr:helix-turn-helix domain-containing protein [Streptomyces uncialis]MCX4661469.1 helix-turn-helix domain-containing protein [Streptomyces uncialis]
MTTTQNDGTHPAGSTPGGGLGVLLTHLLDQVDGKTQKDLAEEAGVSPKTLSAWMTGTRGTSRVRPETLRSLAAVLRRWGVEDVSPRRIFEAAGRPVPGPTDQERELRLLEVYRQMPTPTQRALIATAEAMLKGAAR